MSRSWVPGPTGLALAGELALAGVSCAVYERRTEEPNLTRAFAVHARTLELLDARGLADRLLPRGLRVQSVSPAPGASLDLGILPGRYPQLLVVPQSGTELLLEERARELGVPIHRGAEVVGLVQDDDQVRLELRGPDGPTTVTAAYVVGTDGAHSAVRRLVGVTSPVSSTPRTSCWPTSGSPPPGEDPLRRDDDGGLGALRALRGRLVPAHRLDRSREDVPLAEPVTVRRAARRVPADRGRRLRHGEPRWSTRFLSERRQARGYRAGRVFLAGDAAHVHSPSAARA
jgi:2-polyprenyl-6-methoxyphenol hydroxylase-like FAD-dependent oxidoreductase